MEDIIADAAALGKKIASHPRTAGFAAAARAVAENAEAQAILQAYQQHVEVLREKEANERPIEPDDKRLLAEREMKLAGNPLLKKMMQCQMEYLDMMKRINDSIDNAVSVA